MEFCYLTIIKYSAKKVSARCSTGSFSSHCDNIKQIETPNKMQSFDNLRPQIRRIWNWVMIPEGQNFHNYPLPENFAWSSPKCSQKLFMEQRQIHGFSRSPESDRTGHGTIFRFIHGFCWEKLIDCEMQPPGRYMI